MIIPAINAKNFSEAEKQIRLVEPYAERLHIDVVDGRFADNVTWGNNEKDVEDFAILKTPLKAEIHLMVDDPKARIESWLIAGAKRIIVHVESLDILNLESQLATFYEKVHEYDAQLFLAFNPETAPNEIITIHDSRLSAGRNGFMIHDFVKGFLILGVTPGRAGQQFQEKVLRKIPFLRQYFPNVTIELDGGVTPLLIIHSKEHGRVDDFISASFIFAHERGVETALKELSTAEHKAA